MPAASVRPMIEIQDLHKAFDRPVERSRVADRLALLHEGQIVAEGTQDELRHSRHPAVLAFLRLWLEREEGRHPATVGRE